jgi:hypothetical protein
MAKTGTSPVVWQLFLGDDFPVMARNQDLLGQLRHMARDVEGATLHRLTFDRLHKPSSSRPISNGRSTIAPVAAVVRVASSYRLQQQRAAAADMAPLYRTEMD